MQPTMPIYTTTFPQDFWEYNFQQGAHGPPPGSLRIAYAQDIPYLFCSKTMLVVLEGFLRFPEITQDLSFVNGYASFQLQGFTRHTQCAE